MMDKKSCNRLLMRRMFLAIVTSAALQYIALCCYIFLVNLRTDYTRWFEQTWTTIASLRTWACFLVLVTLSCLQGFLCSKTYLYTPTYYKTRFIRLYSNLTTRNFYLRASFIIIGGILAWLCLSLGGPYSNLTAECSDTRGTCLMEEHLFLLLGGLWSGLYLPIKVNDFGEFKHFLFPIIVQTKSTRLREGISATLPTLIMYSAKSTLYYATGYYLLGSYCREILLSTFSMRMELEPLNTVSNLLNFFLILHLWLYQFIFALTISSAYLSFEIYFTEWVDFKLQESGVCSPDNSALTLIDALSMHEVPIIQHLAYFDLVTLAEKQQERRKLLFTLSKPGGHPYNWNSIVHECIHLLKKFSSDAEAALTINLDQGIFSFLKIKRTMMPLMPVVRAQYACYMRKLMPDAPSLATGTDVKEAPCTVWQNFQRTMKQKQTSFVEYLASRPLIDHVFAEHEENKVCFVFLNVQVVIWAVKALSYLLVSSLKEDSYGVVQKDMTDIINALLSVRLAIDKLHRSPIIYRKAPINDQFFRAMLTSLQNAIKSSFYRIVIDFKPHLDDFSLDLKIINQLQGFLDYKE